MAGRAVTRAAGPRPYRKRRPLPALALMMVLAVAAGAVWLRVLGSDGGEAEDLSCNPPPAAAAAENGVVAGQVLPRDSLDGTAPAPPGAALVRVLNASGQNRQAGVVTEMLRELGFSRIAEPGNDTVYPAGTLHCRGQIRFGPQGVSAARTLSLVEPCAELVRDERQDATVDLAVGTRFERMSPAPEARRVLELLEQWAGENPANQGGLQADGSAAPAVDERLVAAARRVRC